MTQRLRVATWNINSLRLRLPLLERVVAELDPEVICLQETKVPDELFPAAAAPALGYPHLAFKGMKSYNGVAILSRLPLQIQSAAPDWCAKGDCRHVSVLLDLRSGPVELHNFYVPAGGDVPDRDENPKFGHKLDFIAETKAWFARRRRLNRAVLVGDLNIAPLEHDVWSHRQLLRVVSHTPPETTGLLAWQKGRFHDAVRHFVPEDRKLYTWWSYRNRDWRASDRGRRLDHVWVSRDLKDGLVSHTILKDARDWPLASDHVPVCIELEL
jgi:exodeoxyribonuclease III